MCLRLGRGIQDSAVRINFKLEYSMYLKSSSFIDGVLDISRPMSLAIRINLVNSKYFFPTDRPRDWYRIA